MRFSISLALLFSLCLGHGIVELEASHRIYDQLQISLNVSSNSTDQPYRTGYHFQPHKNWINGALLSFNTPEFLLAYSCLYI